MNHIAPQLLEDYHRWTARLANHADTRLLVTMDDVLRGHYLLVNYFIDEGEPIGLFGPRDAHLLPSAVYRQATGFAGQVKWSSPVEQCASLFYGIIKNHPFHDGNKRTALLMALFGLQKLKRIPTAKQREFEQLALRTAADGLSRYSQFPRTADDREVRFIAEFFRKNTRQEDKRYYVVTYPDLDKALKKHGFWLEGPHDNHVTVMTKEVVPGFLGMSRKTRDKKLVSIGCPRWTAQINQKAMKSVLRETGLTPEKGYDSQVLFGDAEPIAALMDTYRNPLRRLRDK